MGCAERKQGGKTLKEVSLGGSHSILEPDPTLTQVTEVVIEGGTGTDGSSETEYYYTEELCNLYLLIDHWTPADYWTSGLLGNPTGE